MGGVLNIVNDVIFCLTKAQTRFSRYKKPELKRPINGWATSYQHTGRCFDQVSHGADSLGV